MGQNRIPHYFGFRIYLSSHILYFFLTIPFMTFLAVQSVPKFMEERPEETATAQIMSDSLGTRLEVSMDLDSIIQEAVEMGESIHDSLVSSGVVITDSTGVQVAVEGSAQDGSVNLFQGEGPFEVYFTLMFLVTLLAYLAGFIYNRRFKRYFWRKRRGRDIPEKLTTFCRKQLFRTPVVNALIVILPNLTVLIFSAIYLMGNPVFEGDAEKELFTRFQILAVIATVLELMFVFYWQKHRVHIRYIDHIFGPEELRSRIFRGRGMKIRSKFLVASGMTTFLPLVIVLVYLFLSLTPIKDFEQEEFTPEQQEILVGPWTFIFNNEQESIEASKVERLFYVNAFDTIVMMVGIGNGIIVSFIYLLLFIRWTNQDITRPVRELLTSIRNTKSGKEEQYTIVRTNDEIGELAEGYNEMTRTIHEYVDHISKMNRDLEATVKERTNEVVMQKEEIEAQKEEIEAQLDLATQQRDTITRQKEQIVDSIRYAEKIQSAILPPVEYLTDTLSDHFILFKPRDIVSGDYYWTTLREDKLLVAVADCTGHGVPGAFLSMLGISSMNEIVNRGGTIQANQVLAQLRDFVIHALHQTGARGEAQDGIEIALCVIDTRNNTMEYAGANRPLYLIRKSKRKTGEVLHGRELIQFPGDRMPIGIYDQEPLPFTNHTIELQRGDCLYMFSDGFVDQLGGPSRKTFRSKYFRKLLLEIQENSMEDQMKLLNQKLAEWQGEVEQIDDILVMGLKI